VANSPEVRIGDAERQAVLDDLRAHLGQGRLTLAEFEERADLALQARTRGDLVPILSDLPALRPASKGAPVRARPAPSAANQTWEVLYRVHVGIWAVLAAFFVLIWLLTGAGYFWPIWPIASIGLSVGIHAAVKRAVQA
jgi:hypothetical protein